MRKAEFLRVKEHILSFYDSDDYEKDFILLHYNSKIENAFDFGRRLAREGWFLEYFEDAENFLRELYGENFDEKIYRTKNGEFRYKNGEVYVWTVYANKIAKAIEKMIEEAGL